MTHQMLYFTKAVLADTKYFGLSTQGQKHKKVENEFLNKN